MNTKTELELRPLEAHELDLVNGAGIPVQQQAQFGPITGAGPFVTNLVWFGGMVWDSYSANELGAQRILSIPAGVH